MPSRFAVAKAQMKPRAATMMMARVPVEPPDSLHQPSLVKTAWKVEVSKLV